MLPLQQLKLFERPRILLISSFLDFVWGSGDEGANCEQGGHDLLGILSPVSEVNELYSRQGTSSRMVFKTPRSPWV